MALKEHMSVLVFVCFTSSVAPVAEQTGGPVLGIHKPAATFIKSQQWKLVGHVEMHSSMQSGWALSCCREVINWHYKK
jgi:hypothetical protein